MNLKIFRNYAEKRLGLDEKDSDGGGVFKYHSFLKDIQIGGIKINSQNCLKKSEFNESKILKNSFKIQEGQNIKQLELEKDEKSEEKFNVMKNFTMNSESSTNNVNSSGDKDFTNDSNYFNLLNESNMLISDDSNINSSTTIDILISGYYDIMNNYIKKHKSSLNELLLNRIEDSEKFLNEFKIKHRNIIDTREILNFASFKKFSKLLNLKGDKYTEIVNSLPLITKIKIYKELKKIDNRSKNYGWKYSLFVTIPISFLISISLYKNFSHLIRHKLNFFLHYVIKIPILLMIPFYFLTKNLVLSYYLRQPLLDLNEIFCEVDCDKENNNEMMKILRSNFVNFGKLIKNQEEYEKIKHIENSNGFTTTSMKRRFFPIFYLIRYKMLMLRLNFAISKEIQNSKKYISCMIKNETDFRISYLKHLILYSHYEKKIDRLFSNLISHQGSDKTSIKEKFLNISYHIRLSNIESKNSKSSDTSDDYTFLENSLTNLRSLHLEKTLTKSKILINIFLFENANYFIKPSAVNRDNNDRNKISKNIALIFHIYEMKFHLNYLKILEIRKILAESIMLHKIMTNDKEAREFHKYLQDISKDSNKTKIHLHPEKFQFNSEYFTINELERINRESKILFKTNVNNLLLHGYVISTLLPLGYLKYKKYF